MPLMLIIEIIAIALAIAYLVLAAYESIWCWLFAGISTIMYTYICFVTKLYLETILQVFYFAMAIYGWYNWRRSGSEKPAEIVSVSYKFQLILIAVSEIFALLFGYYFSKKTDAALPWLDAHVTVFSIVATWMVTKKIIQNWLWWIIIDGAAVYLYVAKDLRVSSMLYAIYVVMVIIGYFKWKKTVALQR